MPWILFQIVIELNGVWFLPRGALLVLISFVVDTGMINVGLGAGPQEMRAAQFKINWGPCIARLDGEIHFYPDPASARDAAEAGMKAGRCRNSWGRKLETPGFFFGFSCV
jgi:hypothetical protein